MARVARVLVSSAASSWGFKCLYKAHILSLFTYNIINRCNAQRILNKAAKALKKIQYRAIRITILLCVISEDISEDNPLSEDESIIRG